MKWAIAILVVLLVITNVYWFYQLIDIGIALSYRDKQIHQLEATGKQLMAILPDVGKEATQEEIIEAASRHADEEPYEKDGCVWVGWLGLKFSSDDRLESVSPVWSFGGKDPCYPAYY